MAVPTRVTPTSSARVTAKTLSAITPAKTSRPIPCASTVQKHKMPSLAATAGTSTSRLTAAKIRLQSRITSTATATAATTSLLMTLHTVSPTSAAAICSKTACHLRVSPQRRKIPLRKQRRIRQPLHRWLKKRRRKPRLRHLLGHHQQKKRPSHNKPLRLIVIPLLPLRPRLWRHRPKVPDNKAVLPRRTAIRQHQRRAAHKVLPPHVMPRLPPRHSI